MKRFISLLTAAALCITTSMPIFVHAEDDMPNRAESNFVISGSALYTAAPPTSPLGDVADGGSGAPIKRRNAATSEEPAAEITTVDSSEPDDDTEKSSKDKISLTIGKKKAKIGSKEVDMPAAPFIQPATDSTMVPLAFAAIAINGPDADANDIISWDAQTQTAALNVNGKTVLFTAGSSRMTVDGKQVLMDNGAVAQIKDGRMFIPFRALGSVLGANVEWDQKTRTASYS